MRDIAEIAVGIVTTWLVMCGGFALAVWVML